MGRVRQNKEIQWLKKRMCYKPSLCRDTEGWWFNTGVQQDTLSQVYFSCYSFVRTTMLVY